MSGKFFLGGPVKDFEAAGRHQLAILLQEGLYPSSKVVDIGCGCLRGGYWLIHFLDKGCYFGIEPNVEMIDAGLAHFLEKDTAKEKCPRFDNNPNFDTSVFSEKFDFFLARSIWTHASKSQIETMLSSFVNDSSDKGVFLTSYLPVGLLGQDYRGDKWVGKSHESDKPGLIRHRFDWLEDQCRKRNLKAKELGAEIFNDQIWLRIEHI